MLGQRSVRSQVAAIEKQWDKFAYLLEMPGRDFDSVAKTLHGRLGGNYRSLEDFGNSAATTRRT